MRSSLLATAGMGNPNIKTYRFLYYAGTPGKPAGLGQKEGAAPGSAGICNTLFYKGGTMMLLGDTKKMKEEIVKAMDH